MDARRIGDDLWKALPDGKAKQQAYYCSRDWGLKKEAVKKRSGGICERCQNNPAENVHHRTYERLYHELLEDLWHLCRDCHAFLHGKASNDPARYFDPLSPELGRCLSIQYDGAPSEPLVSCPHCGQDNSHIREVFTRLGKDTLEAIVYKGTEVGEQGTERRSAIVIVFDGECGHAWQIVIQQHKGTDFLTTELRNDQPAWVKEAADV